LKISDVFQFQRQYSEYYHVLESDFCDTERYLYIDPDNFGSFSSEFIKLIQAICSEIDVTLKFLCTCINPKFKGTTLPEYCKCILDSNPLFPNANVMIRKMDSMLLAPWLGWSYKETTNKRGNHHIDANNPEWWTKYNKIKHDRTTLCPGTGKAYYKYANQKNVLDALAALFIVDSYILNLMCKELPNPQEDATYFLKEWYEHSKLFSGFMVAGL